jgi:hypothetical protein
MRMAMTLWIGSERRIGFCLPMGRQYDDCVAQLLANFSGVMASM